MRRLTSKLCVILAILLLLVLIPVSAVAAEQPSLEDYVDLSNLERYIKGKYSDVMLSDFNIPESMVDELERFIYTVNPMIATRYSFYLYCYDGVVGGYTCSDGDWAPVLEQAANDLLYGIEGNDTLTDLEKALVIHDRLANWVWYGDDRINESHSAYGALVRRVAVCDGYARAYSYLMNRVGVPCKTHSSVSLDHAWNAVQLDGKWYMVDVTWDDTGAIGDDITHDFFLTSFRSGLADELDAEPYDTAYESVQWGDFHYILGGEVYAVKGSYLYRLNGTQLEKVTFPVDGLRNGFSVQIPCLDVGDELLYKDSDNNCYTLNIKTGEIQYRFISRGDLRYNSGRIASNSGDSWNYIFGTWYYWFIDDYISGNGIYNVEFRNWDGTVLKTQQCAYGDLPQPPEEKPVRPAGNGHGYVFDGWGEPITLVSGDKIYTATYKDRLPNGWNKINERWFYYTDSGVVTGWLQQGKDWYYLKESGTMVVGAYGVYNGYGYDYYRFDASGRMITGWYKDGGNWYYYASSGSRVDNAWVKDGGKYYYLGENGVMLTGYFGEYYLDKNGTMQTGAFRTTEGKLCFAYSDGRLRNGWIKHNGQYYYMEKGSRSVTVGRKQIDGKTYYFNSEGVMQTGWVKEDNKWYYFDGSGAMVVGWKLISNKWYYFYNNGEMCTGELALGGVSYYMKDSGEMVVGWYKVDDMWRYYNQSGARVIGWVKDGNAYYYTLLTGKGYATGHAWAGDACYWFDASGRMMTGWIKEVNYNPLRDGTIQVVTYWYYAESDGSLAHGWRKFGDVWYYFAYGGMMQTGRVYINGVVYTFSESGVWLGY